jgi:RimJ/RimL family protein N-acetyltransferase
MKVNIRETMETDRATLDELYAEEEVAQEISTPENADSSIPESGESRKEAYRFTILADGKIAGMIALEYPGGSRTFYQVNLAVGREFWDQGVCAEALRQVVKFGFDELKLIMVYSDTDSDNPVLVRAFQKAGFKKSAVAKEHLLKDGKYVDIITWILFNRGQARDFDQDRITNVTIREMRETDTATLDKLYADEEVAKHIRLPSMEDFVPGNPSSGSRGYNRSFRNERWIPESRKSLKDSYGFTILADGKIAGEIVLEYPSICRSTYNVGFAVGRKFWNQGICTEALKQVVRFAFDELKIHKVGGDNDVDNPASGRVFEKAGFMKAEDFREEKYNVVWYLINPTSED